MKVHLEKEPYLLSVEEAVKGMKTSIETGLTEEEARTRQLEFGKNLLDEKKKKSILGIFINQFLDPIIYILTAAMMLAFFFQKWIEGFAVLFVILMTTLIGFFMELQAVRSVEALQKLTPSLSRVRRNSLLKTINSSQLVPGDIILFEAGDMIPADSRIISFNSLATKESALTGESQQVEKFTEKLRDKIPISDQKNMVFCGTMVSRGNGAALVTATGNSTKIGEISRLSREAEKSRTPLEKKLARLTRKLIWLTLILALITGVSGYLQGKDLVLMMKTVIALAVAAIPEGLPIVATVALARGMLRLSKENVIIKNLESVETLGEVGIVCTDKTGTLTENKMTVDSMLLEKEAVQIQSIVKAGFPVSDNLKKRIFEVAVLCNNAGLKEYKSADPIETALLDFVQKYGGDPSGIRKNFPRLKEIPFETELKRMISIHVDGEHFLFCVKGAMENLLKHCKYVQSEEDVKEFLDRECWIKKAEKMASEGLRTLLLAYRRDEIMKENLDDNLILLGIVGFKDPPRKDVQQAIATYKKAGVKVIMVTGDHPSTAKRIGEEIGLLEDGNKEDKVIYGPDLKNLSESSESEKKKLLNARVFARMIPEQKLQLVNFYQNENLVVGMLGDGVNDTPALKKADVGIAMGIRGTEAAKEVADVILMDDKFTSTELAIRQGRNIFENIRHFVVFLLSCNLAEIVTVAIASASNLPLPLLPLQILFLNLVTDVFPALALGMGKENRSIMNKPPRAADESIITPGLWQSMAIYSFSIIIAVIGITMYAYSYKNYSDVIVNNMAFYTLILAQLLNVFNLPGRSISFLYNKVTRNKWIWGAILLSLLILVITYWIPFFNSILSLAPLNWEQFFTIIAFGLLSVLLTQLIKRAGGTV